MIMKKEKRKKEEEEEREEITHITKEKKIKSKLLSAMKERKKSRQPSPLKKYNRIVSLLVKDLKKKKEVYDIKEIRLQASLAYKGVKDLPLKKINLKTINLKATKPKEEEIEITAVDVDPKWFNDQSEFTYFWQVGDWANQFSNAYPNIPIMLITKATEKNPLVVQGATGEYDGSIFQRWVEEIRDSLPDPNDYKTIAEFVGTPAYKDDKGQIYAVWYETGVAIPKVPPKPKEIEPRKKQLVEEAEEKEKKRYLIEKPKKKRGRPKKSEEEKKKPLPKKTEKPKKEKPSKKEKPTTEQDKVRLAELRNEALKMLKEDFKDGIYTKDEYKEEREKIMNKYEKGGKI